MQRKLTLFIASLFPLFSGLFVVRSKPAPVDFQEYLTRYIVFFILFFFWSIVRSAAPSLLGSTRSIALILSAFVGSLFLFICFYLLKLHFDKIEYELALTCLGLSALSIKFYWNRQFTTWILLELLYYLGIGFLSFQIVHFSFQFQPLIFALGLSAVTVALEMSALEGAYENVFSRKIFPILIVLTPLTIGGLVINNDLSIFHGFIFLLIPFGSALGLLGNKVDYNERLFTKTSVFWMSFIVILASVAILVP